MPPKGHYDSKPSIKRRLRKSTQKQGVERHLDSISSGRSQRVTRQSKKRKRLEEKFEKSGILSLSPVPPRVDRLGRTIWNGHRSGIHWYPGFLDAWWTANGPKDHSSCAYNGDGECGGGMQIDHRQSAVDYILNTAGVSPQVICDGNHHWRAYVLDDEATINSSHPLHYGSGEDTIRTAYHHEENLHAMCAHHNASKGSNRRNLDDPRPPEYVGPCNCDEENPAPRKVRRAGTMKHVHDKR